MLRYQAGSTARLKGGISLVSGDVGQIDTDLIEGDGRRVAEIGDEDFEVALRFGQSNKPSAVAEVDEADFTSF